MQKQRRLEATQILGLVQTYLAGASVRELTRQFGINRTTVLDHLERHGVPRRPHTRKLSDTDVRKAAELYASGLSTVKIGQRLGVDAETIRRELKRAGVALRPRRGQRIADV